jgi:hypothetical protein
MIGSGTDMMPVPPMMGSGAQMHMPEPVPPVVETAQPPALMMGSGGSPMMNMESAPAPAQQMPAVPYKPLGASDEIEGFNFDDVLNPSPI